MSGNQISEDTCGCDLDKYHENRWFLGQGGVAGKLFNKAKKYIFMANLSASYISSIFQDADLF